MMDDPDAGPVFASPWRGAGVVVLVFDCQPRATGGNHHSDGLQPRHGPEWLGILEKGNTVF